MSADRGSNIRLPKESSLPEDGPSPWMTHPAGPTPEVGPQKSDPSGSEVKGEGRANRRSAGPALLPPLELGKPLPEVRQGVPAYPSHEALMGPRSRNACDRTGDP